MSVNKQILRYSALGNIYLVWDVKEVGRQPEVEEIRELCALKRSDGMLTGEGLRVGVWNPDGSEAEFSGNGARIYLQYLSDRGVIGREWVEAETSLGVIFRGCVHGKGDVEVEIPYPRVGGEERFEIGGEEFVGTRVDVGNPHCVFEWTGGDWGRETMEALGEVVGRDARFDGGTNVQMVRILDTGRLEALIWERGVGWTEASGSSASACGAWAREAGLVGDAVMVAMAGGELKLEMNGEVLGMRGGVKLAEI